MADQTYWDEIERYFSKKRGTAMILSPKDWPLITAWQEQGIPVDVICEGIDRAFARFEEKGGPSSRRKIKTLMACQHDIEKLWADHQKTHPSTVQAGEETLKTELRQMKQQLTTKLKSVRTHLGKLAQTPHYHCIAAELMAASEAITAIIPDIEDAEDNTTLATIKQQLRQIEQQLVSRLEDAIAPETHQDLLHRSEAQISAYKQNMKPHVYQETLRIAFLQLLRETYPLPTFV